VPPEFEIAESFEDELADKPADERVYRIALQLHEPARVAEIADRADCAPDTARRHCERLAEIGVLNRISDEPATYQRNEAYFEWRKRNRLTELSSEQRQERLAELTSREREFRDQYGVDGPAAVVATEHADYDELEAVWSDLSEWQTVRQRIERLESVRQRTATDSSSPSQA
jgi:predicted ArsR family transcriptional regulator